MHQVQITCTRRLSVLLWLDLTCTALIKESNLWSSPGILQHSTVSQVSSRFWFHGPGLSTSFIPHYVQLAFTSAALFRSAPEHTHAGMLRPLPPAMEALVGLLLCQVPCWVFPCSLLMQWCSHFSSYHASVHSLFLSTLFWFRKIDLKYYTLYMAFLSNSAT